MHIICEQRHQIVPYRTAQIGAIKVVIINGNFAKEIDVIIMNILQFGRLLQYFQ